MQLFKTQASAERAYYGRYQRVSSVVPGEDMGDIEDFRKNIDELDRQLVRLISDRARAAQEIGKLKRATSIPVYEPNREREIYENVRQSNPGPLPDIELIHIYERIIDVMRSLQKNELASQRTAAPTAGEQAQDSANDSRRTGK